MSRYIDAEPYEDCRIVLHKDDPGVKVKDIPTADVEKVRHGEWIKRSDPNGDEYYECSFCHSEWVLYEGSPDENEWLYCAKCGAKMDGGKT